MKKLLSVCICICIFASLLSGYDSRGFTVCDPNSPANSAMHWSYERLSPQILNLWSLSAAN